MAPTERRIPDGGAGAPRGDVGEPPRVPNPVRRPGADAGAANMQEPVGMDLSAPASGAVPGVSRERQRGGRVWAVSA
jgi:hypothetical protein